MKNILTAAMLCITLTCLAQDEVTVTIAGKITNPNSDSVYIMDGWGEMYELIELDEDHTFESTFTIDKGYYYFNDGKEETAIFLNEGYELYLTLDTDTFDESISYAGTGADANNYLAQKALMQESWGRLDYYGYYCKLEEKAFLKLADSLYNKSVQLLRSHPIKDIDFNYLEYNGIRYEKMYKWSLYPSTHGYITGKKEFKVSSDFPYPFEGLDINDDRSINAMSYLGSVTDHFYLKRDSLEFAESKDLCFYILNQIRDSIQNIKVKQAVNFQFCRNYLTSSSRMDECFEIYKSTETNPEQLELIEAKYLARKKTENGAASPPFSYEDISGKKVTQDDLKGKYVYIDLWATWCGPCLREIPYFDTLQTTFEGQNITFVSICQNDTKERWKATVAKKELRGVQLYAEGDGGRFYEDYQVTGIPRYILLDPQGKIVDSDAKRPSDKRLLVELEALLK